MALLSEIFEGMTPLQKAVVALKQTQARLETLEHRANEPIALVGIGCRLPGNTNSPEAFWQLLCEGRDAVSPVSSRRWPGVITTVDVKGRSVDVGVGGFLNDIEGFDHRFYGMTEPESAQTDPQQRILLEVTWEALEDAGLVPDRLRGSRCGVFLGIATTDYGINLACSNKQSGPWLGAGTALCMAANRISYQFDWRGPSLTLDTACSSSLFALHLACRSLRDGECDLALVGGSNLLLSPFGSHNLAQAGFFSPSGRIRAFDDRADGYVRSDGIALVVLKRKSDLRAGRDRPYAQVVATVVNQDGRSNGLTVPSRKGQEDLLKAACEAAQIKPAEVDYVETQGTGTPMGDSLEAAALAAVYGEGRSADAILAIGSVKTNIGHTETASGAASVIKVALGLYNKILPPSIHFRRPNPAIPFADWKLRVQTELAPWPQLSKPLRAGVSAFGFGGTNVHALLQGVDEADAGREEVDTETLPLLLLSARSETAIRELAERFLPLLAQPGQSWQDLCYSSTVHRQHHEWRLALVAEDASKAAGQLAIYLNGEIEQQVCLGRCNPDQPPAIAFFFGGNAQGAGVQREMIGTSGQVFVDAFNECEKRLLDRMHMVIESDLSLAALQVASRLRLLVNYRALTVAWKQLGVCPKMVGGAGVGAVAAAIEAGVLDFDQALAALAKGEVQMSLAVGAKPSVRLVLQAGEWSGWTNHSISLLYAEGESALAALADHSPQAILDLDQTCLRIMLDRALPAQPDFTRSYRLSHLLAELYTLGCRIDWQKIMHGKFVRLPTYPWQHQPFWVKGGAPGDDISNTAGGNYLSQDRPKNEHVGDSAAPRPRPDLYSPFEAPATPLETAIAQIWSDVLEISPVGRHDHFLELGGDSLRAMMLLNRVEQILQQSVYTGFMLQSLTVAEQAECLRREYPNVVLNIFPEESGVEYVTNSPGQQGTDLAPVDEVLVQRILNLIDSLTPDNPEFDPTDRNPPACFVLAPPRSGSTLLRVMLAGHQRLFAPPELELLGVDTLDQWGHGEQINTWRNGLIEAFRNTFGWSLDQARSELTRWIYEKKPTHEVYALLQQGIGDRLLIDKTPGYSASLAILRKAERWFRDVRYIHLVRHPCDTILSFQEYRLHLAFARLQKMLSCLQPSQISELSWLIGHGNILRFLEEVPPERFCRIYFESLVAHPRQEMERIAAFLGIPFSEEMIYPYRNQQQKMLSGADGSGLSQGDQKFQHQYREIDPSTAGRWKLASPEMQMGELTRSLARQFGYTDLPLPSDSSKEDVGVSLESRHAAELLSRLDDLSDEDVEALLKEQIKSSGIGDVC